jgi:hypothetical protein
MKDDDIIGEATLGIPKKKPIHRLVLTASPV